MLRHAALPLLRQRQIRPPLIREAWSQAQLRCYSRERGPKDSDYKIPLTAKDSQESPSTQSPQADSPLRKIPFARPSPHLNTQQPSNADGAKDEQPSESKPFGADPMRDLDDVSESVSQARRRTIRETQEGDSEPEKQPGRAEDGEAQQQPLPDLTKGIPSTLDAELREARGKQPSHSASLNITEDPSEELPSGSRDRGRDEPPRTEYVSSSDRKKNAVFRYMYTVLGLGSLGFAVYLGRNWENEEQEKAHADAPSGWGFRRFYDRATTRLGDTMSYYRDPVTTKLLPDEDPDPNYRFPFTLVVSLEDMLIHSEWTRDKGWRVAKRPGVDYFLRYLSSYYEIVLFTSQPMAMTEQVLRKLDPYSTIRWPLFREATLYKDGGYVKDLSYLNRDLKKVLIIDTDPHHVKHQPENAIILPKWKGDPKDQTLVQLIPFLEYLATMGFDDSREVLKSFEGTYIPAEFARREKILRAKFEAEQAEKQKKRPRKTLGSLSSMLGMSSRHPDGFENPDEAMAAGKMPWDQIRERGQKQYMELEKKIQEEGEKWLAERDAEEKRFQEEAMKNMKLGGWFSGVMGGGGSEASADKK